MTDGEPPGMYIRTYGGAGRPVIVLHGGPGAAGYMAPVARRLSGSFKVLEPFQRGSSPEPLTVARHVADLHGLIMEQDDTPALVGHSWGAMLALACAAAHPESVRSLVLVGCGTFDVEARRKMEDVCRERTDSALRERIGRLEQEYPDPDERLDALGKLIEPIYSFEPVAEPDEPAVCDARAHAETWADMLRLQGEGLYPAAFARIEVPVVMIHGAYDPHPGRMICESLKPHISGLEYVELEKCGHYPWTEKHAMDDFFGILAAWLSSPAH
ncbi:MAG: alpha/beta hydrolase [Planctomycetes bacterium]|nr:alpha/beta hydrolase [Planctomycetota bacterium]